MKINVDRLTIELAKHEMNTADLARATGYSLNTIREYVNEKRNPTTKSLGKIAKVLNVNVEDLLVN